MSAENSLAELGLELPPPPKALGVYRPMIIVDNLCYTSGHGPLKPDGTLITGRVGADADKSAGNDAARRTGLALLATLRAKLESLDRIKRLIKIFGMVNCTDDFTDHPAVINGCSELMIQVFGEDNGVGVRSAVGMNSLPLGMMVEIEAIFELH